MHCCLASGILQAQREARGSSSRLISITFKEQKGEGGEKPEESKSFDFWNGKSVFFSNLELLILIVVPVARWYLKRDCNIFIKYQIWSNEIGLWWFCGAALSGLRPHHTSSVCWFKIQRGDHLRSTSYDVTSSRGESDRNKECKTFAFSLACCAHQFSVALNKTNKQTNK